MVEATADCTAAMSFGIGRQASEQFAAQIKAEFEVYKKVVDQQKLKID